MNGFLSAQLVHDSHSSFSSLRIVVKVTLFCNISKTLLAICEAYSLGFFIERIKKQDYRGDTADGRSDFGFDVEILGDL
ncbi:hypothetical protein TNCV_1736331 [Trichonephila clavipes]|nr:hypothetical protein TNCV_1736331 [Trichonephila clavipes]